MNTKEKSLSNILIDLYTLFLESDRAEPHSEPTLDEFITFLSDSVRVKGQFSESVH